MNMTKTEPKERRRSLRKSPFWTREKITELIKLYKQNECLWNHFNSTYKCKKERSKALANICNQLEVNKYDVGKKVHNLRNQFNAEMKKLERRIKQFGGDPKNYRCRWEHFDSLLFLRHIIEPRPGYQPHKVQLKVNYKSEDETTTHMDKNLTQFNSFEDVTPIDVDEEDNDTIVEEEIIANELQEIEYETNQFILDDNKNLQTHKITMATSASNATQVNATYEMTTINQSMNHTHDSQHSQTIAAATTQQTHIKSLDESQETPIQFQNNLLNAGGVVEIPMNSTLKNDSKQRDQWDCFGELIAIEFRNLNSDTSRKKLKRKIMMAILEIGEEDDKQ